ncbi:MAG: glycoside hydrolase family 3 C-terminal domain-containing protein [Coriobacteriaceae bacterium]|nr:glycoside hydrolase family 3 C-terminal domain-containing protein [Coriobacteriaceae bacterium]
MGQEPMHDKTRLLAGVSHWRTAPMPQAGSRGLTLSDGPHGLRKQEGKEDHLGIAQSRPATCFPTASALACSFDVDLVKRVGAAIGEEAREQGVDVVLGPGVNVKRHSLCGRNFEYFSEDPLLSGELGAAMVGGIQSQGVAACVKHLAANSQEHARMVSDSVIDERALREIYLAPFEHVVRKAQPWSIMTAYNRLNGTYCSESEWLLRDVLRGEWGFDGAVISDWGAMSSSVASVRSGLDLCMPGPRADHAAAIEAALAEGELAQEDVDGRIGALAKLEQLVAPARRATTPDSPGQSEELYKRHAQLAREAAAQSAVLLKNNGVLPLQPDASVAVIGAFARAPRYQGSGSSRINPAYVDNLWYRLKQRGVRAAYADGYDPSMGETSERQLREAERAARSAEVAIVVVGLPERYESEGFDRKLMYMPKGHAKLIERVCAANPNTVVVLQGGAPMELPWRSAPAAILLTYLAGCQSGAALADVLLGEVNPSGKLAETWPVRLEDTALGQAYPDMDREILYKESTLVGYRYYDAASVEPAFPFGYGLSYTSFEYLSLTVRPARSHSGDSAPAYEVSFEVRNTGKCAGAEVAQLYVAARPGVLPAPAPPQQLAAFAKVRLSPGESKRASLSVPSRMFSAWDCTSKEWAVCPGVYELRVSASSRDIRLKAEVQVEDELRVREGRPTPRQDIEPYAHPYPGCFQAPEASAAFRALCARPLPEPRSIVPFTIDSTVGDMGASWFGRRMFRLIDWVMAEPASKMDHYQRLMMKEMAAEMPLRSLTTSGVPMDAVQGFVLMLNGRYLTGLRKIIGAFLRRGT